MTLGLAFPVNRISWAVEATCSSIANGLRFTRYTRPD